MREQTSVDSCKLIKRPTNTERHGLIQTDKRIEFQEVSLKWFKKNQKTFFAFFENLMCENYP